MTPDPQPPLAPPAPASHAVELAPSRSPLRRKLSWGLLIVALAGVGAATLRERLDRAEPLPVLGQVPDFTLTDRDGRPLSRHDLDGKPWIADFIFTRCGVSCPLMTQRMAKLARELPQARDIRFASFTVDPVNDTPEVLADYARRHNAPASWHFLTGDRDVIFRLAQKGFLLGIDADPPPGAAAPGEPILHSTRFVLVDGQGRLRAFYEGFADGTPEKIERDLRGLLAEGR
jgi:protein SCO1/2